ncbi:MAG: four helix bundle protein [Verrucomicrobia bacterium]|nr:four helix bundle protein [Verrucomicrobiota bacterium]
MGVAKSFRDLRVYRLARRAVTEIFDVTKGFPREERYELTDQIRRSARATKALIAEGWARRPRPPITSHSSLLTSHSRIEWPLSN